jgi:hypothetical protein
MRLSWKTTWCPSSSSIDTPIGTKEKSFCKVTRAGKI